MKRIGTVFLIVMVLLSTIVGTGMYFYLKPEVESALSSKKEEETFENLDVSNYKNRVNILLMGVDTLEIDKKQKNKANARTDTIMLFSIDPASQSGFILSIPRDTYVKISGTNDYTKINHAHSYGGTDLAISTIKEFINLPIHHYVKVDYKALFKTVDDLGGVEFDVPRDMYWTDKRATPPLNINLKKGVQILDADKAMQLVRFRDHSGDGDHGRVKVQQNFIKAVLKKMYSPASIPRIPKFINTVHEYVETDMTVTDMLSLIKIGMNIDLNKVAMATVPGKVGRKPGAGSVVITDIKAFKEQLEYLFSGDYTVDGETNHEANEAAETINDYNIVVLNGSGQSGVARRAADLLKIQNIEVDSSGNASSYDHETTTVYYETDKEAAKKIKEILGTGSIEQGTQKILQNKTDIIVVLGKDFN